LRRKRLSRRNSRDKERKRRLPKRYGKNKRLKQIGKEYFLNNKKPPKRLLKQKCSNCRKRLQNTKQKFRKMQIKKQKG